MPRASRSSVPAVHRVASPPVAAPAREDPALARARARHRAAARRGHGDPAGGRVAIRGTGAGACVCRGRRGDDPAGCTHPPPRRYRRSALGRPRGSARSVHAPGPGDRRYGNERTRSGAVRGDAPARRRSAAVGRARATPAGGDLPPDRTPATPSRGDRRDGALARTRAVDAPDREQRLPRRRWQPPLHREHRPSARPERSAGRDPGAVAAIETGGPPRSPTPSPNGSPSFPSRRRTRSPSPRSSATVSTLLVSPPPAGTP